MGRKTHVKRFPNTRQRDLANQPDRQATKAGTEESDIDQILADSFPASDAPPWTLGVAHAPTKKRDTTRKNRGNR